jgi:hypothetical protein
LVFYNFCCNFATRVYSPAMASRPGAQAALLTL